MRIQTEGQTPADHTIAIIRHQQNLEKKTTTILTFEASDRVYDLNTVKEENSGLVVGCSLYRNSGAEQQSAPEETIYPRT